MFSLDLTFSRFHLLRYSSYPFQLSLHLGCHLLFFGKSISLYHVDFHVLFFQPMKFFPWVLHDLYLLTFQRGLLYFLHHFYEFLTLPERRYLVHYYSYLMVPLYYHQEPCSCPNFFLLLDDLFEDLNFHYSHMLLYLFWSLVMPILEALYIFSFVYMLFQPLVFKQHLGPCKDVHLGMVHLLNILNRHLPDLDFFLLFQYLEMSPYP